MFGVLISTVAGKVLEGSELGAEYWWLNIREPVKFGPAVDSLIESGARAFIEIGAQPILRRSQRSLGLLHDGDLLAVHCRPCGGGGAVQPAAQARSTRGGLVE